MSGRLPDQNRAGGRPPSPTPPQCQVTYLIRTEREGDHHHPPPHSVRSLTWSEPSGRETTITHPPTVLGHLPDQNRAGGRPPSPTPPQCQVAYLIRTEREGDQELNTFCGRRESRDTVWTVLTERDVNLHEQVEERSAHFLHGAASKQNTQWYIIQANRTHSNTRRVDAEASNLFLIFLFISFQCIPWRRSINLVCTLSNKIVTRTCNT